MRSRFDSSSRFVWSIRIVSSRRLIAADRQGFGDRGLALSQKGPKVEFYRM